MLMVLLQLPAFLVAVTVLFWCFQGAALTGFIQFWRIGGPRNDVRRVLEFLKAFHRYRVVKLPGPDVCQDKCVYLTNHRAWCDFFVDMYVTGARAQPLSRLAVGMAFPAFTSSLLLVRSMVLFNRQGVKDTEKFNAWLDGELAKGAQNSLLVYPEGHRSLKAQSLPLRRGMLRYAFTRRLPVQAVVTAGKEEVLNERRRWVHFGRTLVTGCSEVVQSSRFDDFEDFMAEVQKVWDEQWERVHAAPRAGLPELVPRFPETSYTPAVAAAATAVILVWWAVLAALMYNGFRVLGWLASFGTVGTALVAALGAWTAASLAGSALLPPRASSKSSGRAPAAAAAENKSSRKATAASKAD